MAAIDPEFDPDIIFFSILIRGRTWPHYNVTVFFTRTMLPIPHTVMNWVAKHEIDRPISWLSITSNDRHRMQAHCHKHKLQKVIFLGKKPILTFYRILFRSRYDSNLRSQRSVALTTRPRLLAMVRFQSLLAFPADVLLWRTGVRESSYIVVSNKIYDMHGIRTHADRVHWINRPTP